MRGRVFVGPLALVAAVGIIVAVTNRGDSGRPEVAATTDTTTATLATPALDDEAWDDVVGTWGLDGSTARVEAADEQQANLLVTDVGVPDYTVRANLDVTPTSSGLVFRFGDAANYWGFEAIPFFGVWKAFRVVEGVRTDLASFEEPICCREGVLVSATTSADGHVVLSIDTAVLWETDDPLLASNTGAGLFATGGDADDAHFSGVEVIDGGPDASPIVGKNGAGTGSPGR